MNWLDIFKGILGGNPLDGVSKIIEQFHGKPLSDAEKQDFSLKLATLQQQQSAIEAARDQALADIQGQNIRAETTSEDAYVRRARPTFLYVMVASIGMALIVFPLLNLATGKGLIIPEIPDAYLELFGVGFLGYTGARTWEKVKAKG